MVMSRSENRHEPILTLWMVLHGGWKKKRSVDGWSCARGGAGQS